MSMHISNIYYNFKEENHGTSKNIILLDSPHQLNWHTPIYSIKIQSYEQGGE